MSLAMLGLRQSLMRLVRQTPGLGAWVEYQQRHQPILTKTEVDQFQGAGYVVIDPGVPERTIDRAITDLADHPDMKRDLHHGSRVFNGWTTSRAVRSIALAPRVMRILRQLYGREPKPFQTLNFPIGTEQKIHSDHIHFASDPPTYMCGVWVALEDIDMNNGALVYYPGSHRLPAITMEDVAPTGSPEHYPLYEKRIAEIVRENNLKPEYAVLKKGQALIWASNLLHGGSAHHDKHRTRHSQVTHYFFEGCQYYQPLSSYGGYRHLKINEWVK